MRIFFYLTTILVVLINLFNYTSQMVIERKDSDNLLRLNKRQYYRPPSDGYKNKYFDDDKIRIRF